jgi:hypothetical protein
MYGSMLSGLVTVPSMSMPNFILMCLSFTKAIP